MKFNKGDHVIIRWTGVPGINPGQGTGLVKNIEFHPPNILNAFGTLVIFVILNNDCRSKFKELTFVKVIEIDRLLPSLYIMSLGDVTLEPFPNSIRFILEE